MSDTFGDPEVYDTSQYNPDVAGFDWWYGGEPADWWDNQIIIYGADEEGSYSLHDLTAGDWFDLLAQDDDYLIAEYGLDHYDIIDQLEAYDFWTDEDWEIYGEIHGS